MPDFFRATTLKKGKDLVAAQHLSDIVEFQEGEKSFIKGECIPETSVSNKPYKVSIDLTERREVKEARCQCQAGVTGNCKHTAALLHYINEERSMGCTDKEQVWSKPSKKKQELYKKGETIEKIFSFPSQSPPTFRADQEHKEKLANDLASFGLTSSSLYKSLNAEKEGEEAELTAAAAAAEATTTEEPVPVKVKELFYNEIIVPGENSKPQEGNMMVFYDKFVKISSENAVALFKKTLKQALCSEWYKERKFRISASKAHQIANARKEDTCLKYFESYAMENVNLRYGRDTEPLAKEKYQEISRNTVLPSGLVVKPCQPWLCATPDGLVVLEDGKVICLEIKCPISCRGKEISVPYLTENGLKPSHPYYTQVQIQMYCCNVEKSHFFVYSDVDRVLVEIDRDDRFL